MIQIVKEFSNGFNDCITIKSDCNKPILEKTTGVVYDDEVDILRIFLKNFVEGE